jgi:hypothetical protein
MSTLSISEKQRYLDAQIAAGVQVQLGFRGSPEPLQPAKCERVDGFETLYRLHIQAAMPNPDNAKAKPRLVTLPMIFDVTDILVMIEPPVSAAGESGILVPAGSISPGGIHLVGKDGK